MKQPVGKNGGTVANSQAECSRTDFGPGQIGRPQGGIWPPSLPRDPSSSALSWIVGVVWRYRLLIGTPSPFTSQLTSLRGRTFRAMNGFTGENRGMAEP